MKKKKERVISAIIIIIIGLIIFGVYKRNTLKTNNSASVPQFALKNSLPVGTAVNIPKLISINGRKVPLEKKKVFVFVSRECGSCEYVSIAIPKLAKTFNKLIWVYVEKSDEPPLIGNPKINNLYVVRDSKVHLSSIFKSNYTPTFFLTDRNNKIVWKRRGFIAPDYYSLKDVLSAFQNNNYSLLKETYQRNIEIGKKFPEVTAYTYPDNNKIILPDNFKGKPTLIFIFQFSCKSCLIAMNAVPEDLKDSKNINKIVVFSPFSEVVNKEALSFAKEFGIKEMEASLKAPIISTKWIDVNKCFSHAKNTIIINDEDFKFQYSIGWPGASTLIVINKNGTLTHIFSLGNQQEDTLKTFYEKLYKNLSKS